MSHTLGFRKDWFYALACSVLGLGISLNANAEVDRVTLAKASASLVKVQVDLANGGIGMGTGVVVARGKVITNCHVIKEAERIQLVQDGIQWNVSATSNDMHHDLCLLTVTGLNLPAIKLGSTEQLNVGDEVAAAGFAFGSRAHYAQGRVNGLHSYDSSRVVRTTAQFFPGDSGGALIDKNGQLVGILSFFSEAGSGSYFAVPVDWFAARIANMQAYKPIAPIADMPFWFRPSLAELPYFLQAANFESQSQWSSLMTLAETWINREPNNPEAWLARGNALKALGDATNAAQAHANAATIYAISEQRAAQIIIATKGLTVSARD